MPASALAAPGSYATISRYGTPLRAEPDTSSGLLRILPYAKPLTIVCQMQGSSVGGNTIWNKISSPYKGWVFDGLTNTPGRGNFSPGIPRCPEQRAIEWASAQLGKTKQPSGGWWALWCEKFAGMSYDRNPSGYVSANAHYQSLKKRKLIRKEGVPTRGALVFYSSPYGGHVAISIGKGEIITTPLKAGKAVYKAKVSEFTGYLGWSPVADTGW